MNLAQLLSAAAADPLNRWILDVTVRSTLLLLIVAGAVFGLRRISAAGRHFLWGLGLTGSLLLPFVVAITPAIQWKVIPAAYPPVIDGSPATPNSEEAASGIGPRTADVGTSGIRLQRFPESPPSSVTDSPASSVTPADPVKTQSTLVSYSAIPLILWAIGVVLIGAYFAAGWFGSVWLRRKLEPIRDEELCRQARQIAASAGLRAPPLLMQSREVGVPFTLGRSPAVIVLPGDWEGWTVERRHFVLMHETAHIRRNDWWTQWLGWLGATIYWFNPIVWFAVKQLRAEAEKACDDAVLRAGHPPSHYAQELLAIAASLPPGRLPVSPGVPMAQRAKFEGRIRAILNARVNRRPSSKALVVGSVLGVTLLVPVLAVVEVTSEDESAAAPSQSKTTETTSSSAPLKDSIRSISSRLSIEILVSGSDNVAHGLLSPDGKKIAFEGWGWRKHGQKKDDVIVRDLVSGNEVPVTQKAYSKPEV